MKYDLILMVVALGIRTTVVLDEFVVEKVRQLFGGNLSRGVNHLLRQHLFEEKRKRRGFGMLKGLVSTKDLDELESEDAEAEGNDPLLRR